jgi:hypothetical protein
MQLPNVGGVMLAWICLGIDEVRITAMCDYL